MQRWLVRFVALAALFAGRAIVVPGVDRMALEAMKHSGGLLALFNRAGAGADLASLFAVAMMPLLMVSLVLVMLTSSDPAVAARRQRIGAVIYLGWCALAAYSQALVLESTGRGFESDFAVAIVGEGGLRFRALAVLTWLAASAVLWVLSRWVTERGEILGAEGTRGRAGVFRAASREAARASPWAGMVRSRSAWQRRSSSPTASSPSRSSVTGSGPRSACWGRSSAAFAWAEGSVVPGLRPVILSPCE